MRGPAAGLCCFCEKLDISATTPVQFTVTYHSPAADKFPVVLCSFAHAACAKEAQERSTGEKKEVVEKLMQAETLRRLGLGRVDGKKWTPTGGSPGRPSFS